MAKALPELRDELRQLITLREVELEALRDALAAMNGHEKGREGKYPARPRNGRRRRESAPRA